MPSFHTANKGFRIFLGLDDDAWDENVKQEKRRRKLKRRFMDAGRRHTGDGCDRR